MIAYRRMEASSPAGPGISRPRRVRRIGLLAVGGLVFAAAAAAESNPVPAASPSTNLKIYISVDMEGVAGVVTADQLLPGGFEYERFRHFMTDETLAAVRAAKQAGATQIVVSDSHGNGENLLVEAFPKDVRIVRSWPRHGAMMAGLDKSFAAAIFIGYHASTSNSKGVRAHTFSSALGLHSTAARSRRRNSMRLTRENSAYRLFSPPETMRRSPRSRRIWATWILSLQKTTWDFTPPKH
jgi:hypothetical protein